MMSVLSPLEHSWDSFFVADDSEGIHIKRGQQGIEDRPQ